MTSNLEIIMPSLMLQREIEEYLVSVGVSDAESAACEITHMINTSKVVKEEIAEIYKNADNLEF